MIRASVATLVMVCMVFGLAAWSARTRAEVESDVRGLVAERVEKLAFAQR